MGREAKLDLPPATRAAIRARVAYLRTLKPIPRLLYPNCRVPYRSTRINGVLDPLPETTNDDEPATED